ncbi:uncharacterized protein DUF4878 [Luteibacter rhizovicinus]|uniref:Uncharacterized protein DUF4878 n=1 Tax=Luteibacter rhizovicinus TaxID=242606 RepID=A0A4R3YUH1_9GAMM|nr:DUF4878 domain-containing protein [Luteibacter rhizovicinus]TCV96056.1 uncharacterized protein DUF4878 [Luteibacter rhizovicinus]
MKYLKVSVTAFLLSIALLLAACGAGTPERAAKDFYGYIADGKTDKAIDMFSYSDVKDTEMSAARGKVTMIVGEMQARIAGAKGLKSVDVDNVENPTDTTANVAVTLKLGDGTQKKDTLHLVREDGSWKVKLR